MRLKRNQVRKYLKVIFFRLFLRRKVCGLRYVIKKVKTILMAKKVLIILLIIVRDLSGFERNLNSNGDIYAV